MPIPSKLAIKSSSVWRHSISNLPLFAQLICLDLSASSWIKQYSKRQLRPALASSDRFYCHLISPAISEGQIIAVHITLDISYKVTG